MSFSESKIGKYLIDSKAELKKVVWPSKKETTNYTLLVIGISLATAALWGGFDYLFSQIVSKLVIK